MNRIFSMAVGMLCLTAFLTAQPLVPDYHSQSGFLPASGGVYGNGLYGVDNPAWLTTVRMPEVGILFQKPTGGNEDHGTYGVFMSGQGLGLTYLHTNTPAGVVNDYSFALAGGNRTFGAGFGYQWSSGDRAAYNRMDMFSAGFFLRPNEYLSFGLSGRRTTHGDAEQGAVDVGVRPFGTPLLALFGDFSMDKRQTIANGHWSTGLLAEPFDGIRVSVRYFDSKAVSVGVGVSLGLVGVSVAPTIDRNSNHSATNVIIRSGGYDRTLFRGTFEPKEQFVKYDGLKRVAHTKGTFFNQTEPLLALLQEIEHAKNDPAVQGILINMNSVYGGRTLLWEVREKLKEFRASGKKVVIYIERGGIDTYHFASVADRIVMEPLGQLSLGGYIMGRSFLKGTLEKVGLAYDEWRFFKYKSAAETFSRDKMSDADREQRQALVDDMYAVARKDMAERPGFDPEKIDALIDGALIYTAQQALQAGMVDTLARWTEIDSVLIKFTGSAHPYAIRGMLEGQMLPYATWSEPPKIAVIYALGACSMDDGIRARELERKVTDAVEDRNVKAIVLRVDSPGGDALASDYVSEVLKRAKGKKPIVVSQADVAASGGYWLSMHSDAIVAAPNTITGSIGVIGGWIYDKGFKASIGGSTDFVKAGKYADLGYGFTVPLIGLSFPDRPMNADERSQVEMMIRSFYKDFVTRVAEGRGKPYDDIEKVAQGRVWSGLDGKENGLVDHIGGIEFSIALAKEKAGLAKDAEVTVKEYSVQPYFNIGDLLSMVKGVKETVEEDPMVKQLKFRLEHNGRPIPMLPLDEMEVIAR